MTNLYCDLETIPDQEPGALDRAAALVKVPANYKNAETIENFRAERAQEAYEKTSLNGLHGEICSIAWAIGDGHIEGQVRRPGESEKDLIQAFFEAIHFDVTRDGEGGFPRITWIGHNVIDFDLRFLKQRCIVNNIQPPFKIPADARHGSNDAFDTMKAWAGWKGFVSQDALCKALGLPLKAGMTGADVWPAYQAKKYEEILGYNRDDVHTVRELYRRMSWA